jgi:hypothetical protein
VIDRGGRVAYKANWTSAANVETFLTRFLAARGAHPPGTAPVMYETQQIEFRHTDRKRFTGHLLRNGPSAVREFEKARNCRPAAQRAEAPVRAAAKTWWF